MNVFIRAAAERLSAGGVQVDVFTRTRDERRPEVEELGNGSRLINVQAGPSAPVPKEELPRFLPEFLGGVLRRARAEGSDYDLVHTHYWSRAGWGAAPARSGAFPWWPRSTRSARSRTTPRRAASVRNPGPPVRRGARDRGRGPAGRRDAGRGGAARRPVPGRARPHPHRPPGVDHGLFFPRDRSEAKARLHLTDLRLLLFVGRLQAHKGPDVAVRAVAEAIARDPEGTRDVVLAIVGGPSGSTTAPRWPG